MLLYGKNMTEAKVKEMKEFVDTLDRKPKLVIIRIGNDAASERYVKNKIKQCELVGIKSEVRHLPENIEPRLVEHLIKTLNGSYWVDGILLQLPLPKHLDENHLTNLIDPTKEVDGFCATNMGNMVLGLDTNVACTPKGIINLLKFYNVEMQGKDVLVINRSNIVGKPLVHLFTKENATVTLAHSRTNDLDAKIMMADIIVTAVGKKDFIDKEMIDTLNDMAEIDGTKTIIDVSINVDSEGKLCGDVYKDYEYINDLQYVNVTPVPGGVGLCTVSALLENTIDIYKRRESMKK